MDGTLVPHKSSWVRIHERFGTTVSAARNLRAYEQGNIDYEEFARRDIALWPPRLHISEIRRILLSGFRLSPGALIVVSSLRKRGYQIAIVSAGLDLLAHFVAARLSVTVILANGLETSHGFLTGAGIVRVELLGKDKALRQVAHSLGLSPTDCIAVGDSKYDVSLLRNAGLGVAVNGDEDILSVAHIAIKELVELLEVVR